MNTLKIISFYLQMNTSLDRFAFGALIINRRTSVVISIRFLDGLPHPAAHTEQMRVESIFTIPVAALTPWNDANLIPALILWILKKGTRCDLDDVDESGESRKHSESLKTERKKRFILPSLQKVHRCLLHRSRLFSYPQGYNLEKPHKMHDQCYVATWIVFFYRCMRSPSPAQNMLSVMRMAVDLRQVSWSTMGKWICCSFAGRFWGLDVHASLRFPQPVTRPL